MRRELRIEVEARERFGQIERPVDVLARDEQLRRAMLRRDGIDVIALADDERDAGERERGEREARRDDLASRRRHADVGQRGQRHRHDERDPLARRDADRMDDEVTRDAAGDARDRKHAVSRPAQTIGRMHAARIGDDHHGPRERDDRGDADGDRELVDKACRSVDPERGGPQRERADHERTQMWRRDEHGTEREEDVAEDALDVRVDVDGLHDVHERKGKEDDPRRARHRPSERGHEDDREEEAESDGHRDIGGDAGDGLAVDGRAHDAGRCDDESDASRETPPRFGAPIRRRHIHLVRQVTLDGPHGDTDHP